MIGSRNVGVARTFVTPIIGRTTTGMGGAAVLVTAIRIVAIC
jgi:hypothetical protein